MSNYSEKIIILGYNKPTLTSRCVRSILDAGYPVEQLLYVDNGSDESVRETLKKEFQALIVLELTPNSGFAGGFNAGLSHVKREGCQAALFLTNDTELLEGTLEACRATAQSCQADMVAPCICFRKSRAIDSCGGYFDSVEGALHHHRERGLPALLADGDYIPGTAIWLRTAAFAALNGMREDFHMYWEDVDFSFRARSAGMVMARCEFPGVLHGVGQTCRKKPIYTTYYYQRNRIRFCREWLAPQDWQALRPRLRRALEAALLQAQNRNDTTRIGYLTSLFDDLDEG